MSKLNEIVKQYSIKYDRKIKQICAPLNDCLGIPIFVYFQVHEDGTFCNLSNYAEQSEFYYQQNLHLVNPYYVHPKLIRSGSAITATTNDPRYLETEDTTEARFQMTSTFLMVEKIGNRVEGFLFAQKKMQDKGPLRYFNQMDLLKKFSHYFLQETQTLIGKMQSDGFNIAHEKGKDFLVRPDGLPLSNNDEQTKKFLKAISPLSKREVQCVELFRQGKSAQATAAILGLSHRTVEHYFDNIKNKLGVNSKWDLLNR